MAICVHSIVAALRPDTQSNTLIEGVFLQLYGLYGGDGAVLNKIAQVLTLVCLNPLLMHLEQDVGFMWSRSFPVQGRPRSLQLVED